MLYRVPAAEGDAVMAYLIEREMLTGVYNPCWLHVRSDAGPVTAITYVVDRGHGQYTGRLTLEQTIERVLQGVGDRGSCLDYLRNTVHHLRALGLPDRPLERLLKQAEARRGA